MNKRRDENKPIVWTIAGSDSGGGAGIQADLHTFQDFAVHGCSVITAVTAQNSKALQHSEYINNNSVSAQIEALATDLPADVIKLGMLADTQTVQLVINYLDQYSGFVVCDPVMVASRGGALLSEEGVSLVRDRLLPRIDLLTPNVPEAQSLTGLTITSAQDVINAAKRLIELGARSVLITGGHWHAVDGCRLDYWTDGEQGFWLAGADIKSEHSHGSGCTLSSAIAAMIARGYVLADAMVVAKAYVTQGIRLGVRVGAGPGPVSHQGWPSHWQDFPLLSPQLPQAVPVFQPCGGHLGLYPVVDSAEWIAKLIPLGVPTIQLRIKDVSEAFARQQISAAITLCKKYKTRLFINDYWQLAIELGAYGVHLGQEDLENADLTAIAQAGLRLGLSTHSYYEIARAHAIRPSYIAIGPVYCTTTKVMKFSELGIAQLKTMGGFINAALSLNRDWRYKRGSCTGCTLNRHW
ncbi:MAG: bifunctional hydroxymethylpyrimidine kinase/phosphomethylpyrimidine kinase [Spongiibacteraceae bacterium]|nr:bifunctional hydroxymethylpyrimidine kinase/phosphomethylpyrimidine kinase [Spongiibacteraceae bacterium]